MKIGIIGAGHAGVAAAQALSKENIDVTLFSDEKYLPYYRPRVPAVAFGQTEFNDALMHPESWYSDKSIKLMLNSKVTDVSPDSTITTENGSSFKFDKVIFTYGSKPIMPDFRQGDSKRVVPLWDLSNAEQIKELLSEVKHITIIGGGIIGLETAMRAIDAEKKVTIIEKAPSLLSRNLNPSMSKLLSKILKEKGIEVKTGISIEELIDNGENITVKSDTADDFETGLVIVSIGAYTENSLPVSAGINCNKKIEVDNYLQTEKESFLSAGDNTEVAGINCPCSALRASKQGKISALNAVSPSSNYFEESPVTLQVKYNDFSLFAVGNTIGTENIIEKDEDKNIYRTIITDSEAKVIGVQMIGSNKDFKYYEKAFLQGGSFDKL